MNSPIQLLLLRLDPAENRNLQPPEPRRQSFAFARLGSQMVKSLLIVVSVFSTQLLMPSRLPAQQSGIWFYNTTNSRNWSLASAWFSGSGLGIANGAGFTADFSEDSYLANMTVHLDTPRTIGNLIFGDCGNQFNWTLDNNGSSANVLTLAVSSGTPAIDVTNQPATISAVLAGNQGLSVNPTTLKTPLGTTLSNPVGTLFLTGMNTYSGGTTLGVGTLNIAADSALGTTTASPNIVFNGGGVLQFGANLTISSGRNLLINPGITATLDTLGNSDSIGGVINGGSNASGLTILSSTLPGSVTLNGAAGNTYSGPTTVRNNALVLDFSNMSTPTNLINSGSALVLGGGSLAILDKTGAVPSSQTFSGTTINAGSSAISVNSGASVSAGSTLALGAIARAAGGTLNFSLPVQGAITTTTGNTGGMLGGWATVAGTDWAAVDGSQHIGTLTSTGGTYVNDTWTAGNNTTVTVANDFSSSATGLITNSLRFNAPVANSILLPTATSDPNTSPLPTLTSTITSGGILVTPNVGSDSVVSIGPGTQGGAALLTSGSSQNDLIVNQYSPNGALMIAVPIVDNGSAVSLIKNGPGTLILAAGTNVYGGGAYSGGIYTGSTYINQGTLSVLGSGSLSASGPILFAGNGVLQFATSMTASLTNNITVNAGATATIDYNNANTTAGGIGGFVSFSGIISGAGGFTFINSIGNTRAAARLSMVAPQTSSSVSIYTGPTTIYDGNLNISFSLNPNVPSTTPVYLPINGNNVLNLGGTLSFQVQGGLGSSQINFNLSSFVNLIANSSSQLAGNASTGILTLNGNQSNGIVRNPGATLNVALANLRVASNGGVSSVTNTNGIIGGWATYGPGFGSVVSPTPTATDWAAIVPISGGFIIGALPAASYTNDTWASGNNTTVTHELRPGQRQHDEQPAIRQPDDRDQRLFEPNRDAGRHECDLERRHPRHRE